MTVKKFLLLLPVWALAIYATLAPLTAVAHSAQTISTPTPFLPNFDSQKAEIQITGEEVAEVLLKGNWPVEIRVIETEITKASLQYGLNRQIYASVIKKESWFPISWADGWIRCPDGPVTMSCTSSSGAIGVAQVIPFHFSSDEDGRDLWTNVSRGAEILAGNIQTTGSVRTGLAAYVCGPNDYDHQECWDYADEVLEIFKLHVGHAYPNPDGSPEA